MKHLILLIILVGLSGCAGMQYDHSAIELNVNTADPSVEAVEADLLFNCYWTF